MKQTPYNFCDYRCERCLETDRCDVYKKLQQELELADGDDASGLLASLQASFRETENLIKQRAREFGIDIDGIAGGSSPEEIFSERTSTVLDELYQETHAFTGDTHLFVQHAEPLVRGTEREYLDDIAWHRTIISAKVYRALGWKSEGEIADDARDSAAVAMKSLTICIMAFEHLAATVPGLEEQGRRLSAEGAHLKEKIKKKFKP